MKKVILILLGFIPLPIGFLMNSWLMENQDSILPFLYIGILFLAFWALLGFITCKSEKTPYHSALFIHTPAIIAFLLLSYQDRVLEQIWPNMIGIATQNFYLPLINLSSIIIGGGLYVEMWLASGIAFLLMYGSYYLGCYLNMILSKQ
ncbi:hypothetical protein [Ureibacillus acetophenoni]|uniref:Uncharacterized protein n=1 Tax=Ureibacillus acetophenoni TaxID=614649 RepID=A0A285UPM9_9BACL|nr:hypothetical protein [Ureibacillus acetophenoni]SOC43772.1 hypothetical protein SAMN05877842_11742 [Ureibacillus acetophenoni]